jgi:hypothetical protein
VLIPAGVARQQGKIVTLAHGDVAFAGLLHQFCKNVSAGEIPFRQAKKPATQARRAGQGGFF